MSFLNVYQYLLGLILITLGPPVENMISEFLRSFQLWKITKRVKSSEFYSTLKPTAYTYIISLSSLTHFTRSHFPSFFLPLITYLLISRLSRVKRVKSEQMRCHVCWRRDGASVCEDVVNIWLNLKPDTFITHSSPHWMKWLIPPGILLNLCDISRMLQTNFFCVLQKKESHTGDARVAKWCIFIFGWTTRLILQYYPLAQIPGCNRAY